MGNFEYRPYSYRRPGIFLYPELLPVAGDDDQIQPMSTPGPDIDLRRRSNSRIGYAGEGRVVNPCWLKPQPADEAGRMPLK